MKKMNDRVKRLADYGYNPIHLFGDLWLARNKSRNYCRFSYYSPIYLPNDRKPKGPIILDKSQWKEVR